MTRNFQLILGATWQYLNQPINDHQYSSIWEIRRFWYLYQIQMLENCWEKETSSESNYTQ
jgi:hypothetical protein